MTDAERQHINELIVSVAKGDKESLGELFTLCYSGLFSVAKNITRSREGAEDVVQETFVRVVRAAGTFKKKDNGYGWLCTIVRNTALTYVKKNAPYAKNLKDIDECYELFDASADPSITEQRTEIKEALSALEPLQRRLLYLKYYCDMTVREIAAAENMKKSTVAYTIAGAEKKLRELLK